MLLADVLYLENGNLLSGRILELKDSKVHFETHWAGLIKVDVRYVQSMETEALLWVRMRGQDNFRLVKLYRQQDETWLEDEAGNRSKLGSQERLASLKADQPEQDRWIVSGNANVNLGIKRSEKRETDFITFGSVNIRGQGSS